MTANDTTGRARAGSSPAGLRPLNFMSWFFPFFWLVFLSYPLAASLRLDGAQRFWGVSLTVAFAVVFYLGMIAGGIGLGTFVRTMRAPRAHRTRQALIVVNAALIIMIAITVVAVPLVGEEALSYLAYISVIAVVSVRRVIPGLAHRGLDAHRRRGGRNVSSPGWSHRLVGHLRDLDLRVRHGDGTHGR